MVSVFRRLFQPPDALVQVPRLFYQTKALSTSTEGSWTIRYFGNTNFGRKYLNQLPREVIERGSGFGVSRYRVREEYLPK